MQKQTLRYRQRQVSRRFSGVFILLGERASANGGSPRIRKRQDSGSPLDGFPVKKGETRQRTKQSGRPSKLSVEDQVLMTLEYWREYRTHFHIGVSWGLDETNVLRNIRKVENILIKSGLTNSQSQK